MLDFACYYENKVQEKILSIWYNEDYKFYYSGSGYSLEEFPPDTTSSHAFVSYIETCGVRQVIGLITYDINRETNCISNLGIIKFPNEYEDNELLRSQMFMMDLRQAIDDIFTKFNFSKIEFSVIIGNPMEKGYDRWIKRFGGRVVGTFSKRVKLYDNQLYDEKFYEIMREDYIKQRGKRK